MKLETMVTIILMAGAVASGLEKLGFWWLILPAFLAGSLALSNGPHYPRVIQANQDGNMWYFPLMLTIHVVGKLFLAGAIFWITRWLW